MKLELEGTKGSIPAHIVIIPDGNRRWARHKGLSVFAGHEKSASFGNTIPILEEARKLGVKYMTFWAFSTENWNRSGAEKDFLFNLIHRFSKDFKDYAIKNKIRFRHLGRKDRIPKKVAKEIEDIEEKTKNFDDFNFQLCLDYGGRDEMVRAVNKLIGLGIKKIKEEDILNSLDSAGIPDPDLIIRTSGERRTSGFMPLQADYAELYFEDKYFPDFGPKELRKAVDEFGKRKRNFGK